MLFQQAILCITPSEDTVQYKQPRTEQGSRELRYTYWRWQRRNRWQKPALPGLEQSYCRILRKVLKSGEFLQYRLTTKNEVIASVL